MNKITSNLDDKRFGVSLVYPPYGSSPNEPNPAVVSKNYGLFPSLSLGYVAAILEGCGCRVQFIDANALGISLPKTIELVRTFKPDLVGYTITTPLFYQTYSWLKSIKQATEIRTIVGGAHVAVFPKETMLHPEIDMAIVGEAEETLPELIDALRSGRDPAGMKGTIIRQNGETVFAPLRQELRDLDAAPFPARHLWPNERYYSFISRYRNFTPLITSRGCPFKCIFCEQGNKTFRARSAENVVCEMEECITRYGVGEFDFFDSSFTTRKDHVLGICEKITQRGIKTVWAARSRVDLVDEEILKALHRAGCKRIYYGIESGDPEILSALSKKVNLEQAREALRLTKEIGIETFGFFMIGSPNETKESVQRTFEFVSSVSLDYVQYSKVVPLPGTKLYEMLLEETGYDYWREFIAGRTSEMVLKRPRTNLTEKQIQSLVREGYLKFYFRPLYVLRALKRIRSWAELKRSIATAWQVFIARFSKAVNKRNSKGEFG